MCDSLGLPFHLVLTVSRLSVWPPKLEGLEKGTLDWSGQRGACQWKKLSQTHWSDNTRASRQILWICQAGSKACPFPTPVPSPRKNTHEIWHYVVPGLVLQNPSRSA